MSYFEIPGTLAHSQLSLPPHEVYALRQMAEEHGGTSVHALPRQGTAILAQRGIYTTTEPRYPGSFADFRDQAAASRELDKLAQNTSERLRKVEGYEDAGDRIGSRLAFALAGIVAIHGENLYVMNPDRRTGDGTVAAERMLFTVPGERRAWLLEGTLQALIQTRLGIPHTVRKQPLGNGLYEVSARNVTEYMPRVISSAATHLVAHEDLAAGFVMPPYKRTVQRWKQRGETLPPDIDLRQMVIKGTYHLMKTLLSATRNGEPIDPIIDEDPLGTEAAASLEGMRKVLNALIWEIRGGSHLNQEQDKNLLARTPMEENVDLRRDPVSLEERQSGPPNPRAVRMRERMIESSLQTVADTRKHPVRAGLTMVGKAAGAGIETGLEFALEHTPGLTEDGRQLVADYRAWQRKQRAALASHMALDALIGVPHRPEPAGRLWTPQSPGFYNVRNAT